MSLLPLFTTIAIVIGLCSALPQLGAMLRARSAAGQSPVGWSLGALVNMMMAYVNVTGYDALLPAVGNVGSLLICLAALALILRLGRADEKETEALSVHELPTTEFHALRDLLEDEARRRTDRRRLEPVAA